ncbi:MAG: hypothetical protein CMO80_23830 [Verrucomicrobiales bacterium]|nr:hypothetical protein [Verrucomicrobiales bacterium]
MIPLFFPKSYSRFRLNRLIPILLLAGSVHLHANYVTQVRADRPVAWWSFEEVSGIIFTNRNSGPAGKRHGVNSGKGVRGAGLEFAGGDARVDFQLDDLQDRGLEQIFNRSFTLEFWLLDEAAKPDNRRNYSLFYKADSKAFTHNSLWLYRARGDGNYYFRIRGRGDDGLILKIPNPAGNHQPGDLRWHHLAITVELTGSKRSAIAYLDGQAVAQTENSGPAELFDNSGPLLFGSSYHRGSPWRGSLDELAIYDRALSPADIIRHHEAGRLELNPPPPPQKKISREEHFELHVRPLLVQKCADCHSGKPSAKNRLYVLSRDALLRGGDYGPAIVPGDSEASLLLESVKRIHKELKMPPDASDRLTAREIDHLVTWVNDGAYWPKEEDKPATTFAKTGPETITTDHWSFQKRAKPLPPREAPPEWSTADIDRFLHRKHRENQVIPTGLADRRTLIRRATLDLIGLPPTADEVASFLDDPADDEKAFAKLIDRLLASRHYGERWGRHWLDVARYADTQGDVGDYPIPAAYKYRNWVIDALNRDMPFDEFIQRQIAGDIMAEQEKSETSARESIIATGFVALSRRVGNTKTEDRHLIIEDTLDTIGRGVLGLTLRCARCHDHKFDPVLNRDYYGLYGVFAGTRYPWMGASDSKSPSDLSPGLPGVEPRKKTEEYFRLLTRYEYQINNHFRPWLKPTLTAYKKVTAQIDAAKKKGEDTSKLETERERHLGIRGGKFRELMLHGLKWLQKEKFTLAHRPAYDFVFAVSETKPTDTRIHLRGNPKVLGELARRSAPLVMGGESFASTSQSGRLELVRWLTRDDHPLTPRVIVNRVWAQHFGRGLVPTLDDFGAQGQVPSHPQLLDWLANRFVAEGWSLKQLHRRIMFTRAYRLSGERSEANLNRDPENQWLWHFPRRRLEAEAIRDSILFVADRLDTEPGGPHPFKPWYSKRYSLNGPFNETYPTRKRSVYMVTQRIFRHPFLGLFDGPDTTSSTSQRKTSNNPGQALYLMNSEFVREQSLCFADRALEQPGSDREKLQWIWKRCYARSADADELALATAHIERYAKNAGSREHVRREAWASLCRAVLTSNEFFHVD